MLAKALFNIIINRGYPPFLSNRHDEKTLESYLKMFGLSYQLKKVIINDNSTRLFKVNSTLGGTPSFLRTFL
jgi:hypothetical protein